MTARNELLKERIFLLLYASAFNFLIYNTGRIISENKTHIKLATMLDTKIPFLPWMILVYWGCYLFWIINYYLGVKYEESRFQFLTAHYIGEFICFLLFVCFPTTMIRPVVTGTDLFSVLTQITYKIDRPDNLFPSIHCFVSWLCWIGVRGNKYIPIWYRKLSMIFALLVCASTLVVKQHVVADVLAGISLAELSFYCAKEIGKWKIKRN